MTTSAKDSANSAKPQLQIDGKPIGFDPGDTLMNAASKAGVYIPHLCHHNDLSPHGSCRVCIVKVDGRIKASCITPAENGMDVKNHDAELIQLRKRLIQMLFVEGNHFCPSCEMSGQCQLQALAYDLNMLDTHFDHFYPQRPLDCTHPEFILDRDRCINCELCVRASSEIDGKQAFSLGGRGQQSHLQANTAQGTLAESNASISDTALNICPVGALLPKSGHYKHIAGERIYDKASIHDIGNVREPNE